MKENIIDLIKYYYIYLSKACLVSRVNTSIRESNLLKTKNNSKEDSYVEEEKR